MFGEDIEKDLEGLQDNPSYLRARVRKLNNILDEKEKHLKTHKEIVSLKNETIEILRKRIIEEEDVTKAISLKYEAMKKAGDKLVRVMELLKLNHSLGSFRCKQMKDVIEDFKRLKEEKE